MSDTPRDGPLDKPEMPCGAGEPEPDPVVEPKKQREMPRFVFWFFWLLNFGGLATVFTTMFVLGFSEKLAPDWTGYLVFGGIGLWILTFAVVEIFGSKLQKQIIFGTLLATFALAFFAGILAVLLSYPLDEGLIPDELQEQPGQNP